MKLFSLLFVVYLLPQVLIAGEISRNCPVLRGVYQCPADQGDAPFKMEVRQSGIRTRVVRYTWNYSDGTSVSFLASRKPTYNADTKLFGVCLNGGVYISRSPTDLTKSLRNERTPSGDYLVTDSNQKVVMLCSKE